MFQSHVVLRLETDTSTENVDKCTTLLSKSIDDWSSWWSQWGFEHIAEDAKNAMELLKLSGSSAIGGLGLPLNAGHHLTKKDKINDEW